MGGWGEDGRIFGMFDIGVVGIGSAIVVAVAKGRQRQSLWHDSLICWGEGERGGPEFDRRG